MMDFEADRAISERDSGATDRNVSRPLGEPSRGRRAKRVVASVALLVTAFVATVMVFVFNDPTWIKWSVGLVLAFNMLVGARVALSPARHSPTAKI